MPAKKPPLSIIAIAVMVIAILIVVIGTFFHSIFMNFITLGELNCLKSKRYCIEMASIYFAGSLVALSVEFGTIYMNGRSYFSNPLILVPYILIADLLLSLMQLWFPNIFHVFEIIGLAMGTTGSPWFGFTVSITSGLVSLVCIGGAYLWIHWHVIVKRLNWVAED